MGKYRYDSGLVEEYQAITKTPMLLKCPNVKCAIRPSEKTIQINKIAVNLCMFGKYRCSVDNIYCDL